MTFGILALGFPVSEGFAAFGGSQSHFLPYLNAFLRWRLASWLWGSLFRRVLQPLGAHSLSFFPILPYLNAFLRWRLASWLWGSLFRRVLQPLGAHSLTFFPILPYLNAFLRWRLASWLWGSRSLFRRVLQPLGAHSLTFFPILPYPYLGFPVSEGFAAFGGSQSHFLPYSSLS